MSINIEELNVTLPDGVTKTSEPVVESESTVTFNIKGSKATVGEVSVEYQGTTKTASINIIEPRAVKMTDLAFDKQTAIGGEVVTLTATFSGTPEIGKFKVTIDGEATEKTAPAVSGSTITATYTLAKKDDLTVTANAIYEDIDKLSATVVTAHPTQICRRMDIIPADVKVGEDINIIFTYTENTTEADYPHFYQVPEGVSEKTPATCEGNTVKVVYTADTEGEKSFSATIYEGLLHEVSRNAVANVTAAE